MACQVTEVADKQHFELPHRKVLLAVVEWMMPNEYKWRDFFVDMGVQGMNNSLYWFLTLLWNSSSIWNIMQIIFFAWQSWRYLVTLLIVKHKEEAILYFKPSLHCGNTVKFFLCLILFNSSWIIHLLQQKIIKQRCAYPWKARHYQYTGLLTHIYVNELRHYERI